MMIVMHKEKVRWLFWLNWKLLIRGFVRERARIVGTIIQFIIFVPLFGAAAVGVFAAFRLLPAPANFEVLYLLLTGVTLLWIILPMMQYNFSEGLDISKLMQFPLTRWEIMAGLLFSTLLSIFTIGLVLLMLAVIAGFAVSIPAALLAVVTMLVFYVQVVGLSQLVLALLSRVLQSRRFRDLSYILIVLFSSSCYLIQQLVFRGIGSSHFYQSLMQQEFSAYLQWTPPGIVAHTLQAAVQGNWLLSLGLLLINIVIALVVLYLWQLIIERSLVAPETGGRLRARRRAQPAPAAVTAGATAPAQPAAASANPLARLFSPQTLAITVKEFKYYRRDPQIQALLFQSVVYMFIIVILPLLNLGGAGTSGRFSGELLFEAPLVVFLYMFSLSYNTLGLDREALTTLFLFPVKPQSILFGKNLAVFCIGIVEMAVLIAVGALLTHASTYVLPTIVAGLAGMGVVLGCGNLTSVLFPQRMRQMRRFAATGASMNSGNGCMRGIMVLAMMVVALIILLPVGAALALPILFNAEWAWVITVPLSLAYGIAFHQIATRLVAPRIITRAPEILAATTRE